VTDLDTLAYPVDLAFPVHQAYLGLPAYLVGREVQGVQEVRKAQAYPFLAALAALEDLEDLEVQDNHYDPEVLGSYRVVGRQEHKDE
jgi:hypothetical protein